MGRKELIEKAKQIPHMGAGDIGKQLIDWAAGVPENTAIVECGVWMGSGTAFLSIGCEGKRDIFAFDHFKANSSECEKLKACGVEVEPGENTIKLVKQNLRGFSKRIHLNQKDLLSFKWNGEPIGLYVDDVSKRNPYWAYVAKHFLPHVVVGGVIVLMDYYFFRKTGRMHHKTQFNFMERHKDYFEMIFEKDCIAAFRVKKQYKYKGV